MTTSVDTISDQAMSNSMISDESIITRDAVKEVLKQWDNTQKLGEHPLCRLQIVEQCRHQEGYKNTPAGRAMALRSLIAAQLEEIRPPKSDDQPDDDPSRYYIIITEQFINGLKATVVVDMLGITRGYYYQKQRDAFDYLANRLREQTQGAVAQQSRPTEMIVLPEGSSPPDVAGFVGRDVELTYFRQKLEELSYIVITGFPGVGKTDLAAKLVRQVADPEHVFWHKCREGDGVESLIWALAAFLGAHGHDGLWRFLQAAGQSEQTNMPLNMRIGQAVQLLSQNGYMVCLDDFQTVDDDPDVQHLAQRLYEATQQVRLKLVITSHRMPRFVRQRFEPLRGLTQPDAKRLVATRNLHLPEPKLQILYTYTEGHALFLNLAIDVLMDATNLDRLLANLLEESNIEHYLLSTVDKRLSADERVVMGAIAVLGTYGGNRSLIEIVADGGSVRQALRELSNRHLLAVSIGDEGRTYSQHAIVQAFYYDNLGLRERKSMHRRAGEQYAATDDPLNAARNFCEAGDHPRAVRLATQNIRSLLHEGKLRPLFLLLDSPELSTLDALDQARVQIAWGQVYTYMEDRLPAQTNYEAALGQLTMLAPADEQLQKGEAAEENAIHVKSSSVGVATLKYQAYRGLGYLLRSRQPAEALRWLDKGLSEVRPTEPLHHADLLVQKGVALSKMKEREAAEAVLKQGLAMLSPESTTGSEPFGGAEAERIRLLALMNLGNHYFYQNEMAQAEEYLQQALTVAEALDDPSSLLSIRMNLATYQHATGDWVAARQGYQAALVVAEKLGKRREEVRLGFNLGMLAMQMGDDKEAQTTLTQALDLAQEIGFYESRVGGLAYLAELHLLRNELERAQVVLAEAERLARETQVEYQSPMIYRLYAELFLAHEELVDAEEYAQRSIDTAQSFGMHHEAGPAWRVLAQTQLVVEQPQQAINSLQASLDILNDDPYEAARTQVVWGHYLLENGAVEDGHQRLQTAQTTFETLHAARNLAEVTALLNQSSAE
ncbi:tetratricopeptide repeat protein [Chloroflexi bacterium TSY]|nr:tetratricopeptide repeat protein [Chloroflexi bacterium TSY]